MKGLEKQELTYVPDVVFHGDLIYEWTDENEGVCRLFYCGDHRYVGVDKGTVCIGNSEQEMVSFFVYHWLDEDIILNLVVSNKGLLSDEDNQNSQLERQIDSINLVQFQGNSIYTWGDKYSGCEIFYTGDHRYICVDDAMLGICDSEKEVTDFLVGFDASEISEEILLGLIAARNEAAETVVVMSNNDQAEETI